MTQELPDKVAQAPLVLRNLDPQPLTPDQVAAAAEDMEAMLVIRRVRSASRQIALFLEDGSRERLIVAQEVLREVIGDE